MIIGFFFLIRRRSKFIIFFFCSVFIALWVQLWCLAIRMNPFQQHNFFGWLFLHKIKLHKMWLLLSLFVANQYHTKWVQYTIPLLLHAIGAVHWINVKTDFTVHSSRYIWRQQKDNTIFFALRLVVSVECNFCTDNKSIQHDNRRDANADALKSLNTKHTSTMHTHTHTHSV